MIFPAAMMHDWIMLFRRREKFLLSSASAIDVPSLNDAWLGLSLLIFSCLLHLLNLDHCALSETADSTCGAGTAKSPFLITRMSPFGTRHYIKKIMSMGNIKRFFYITHCQYFLTIDLMELILIQCVVHVVRPGFVGFMPCSFQLGVFVHIDYYWWLSIFF